MNTYEEAMPGDTDIVVDDVAVEENLDGEGQEEVGAQAEAETEEPEADPETDEPEANAAPNVEYELRRELAETREKMARLEGRLEGLAKPEPAKVETPKYNFPPALRQNDIEEIANTQGPGAAIAAYNARNVMPVLLQMHDKMQAQTAELNSLKEQMGDTAGYTVEQRYMTGMTEIVDGAERSFLSDIKDLPEEVQSHLHRDFTQEMIRVFKDPNIRQQYVRVNPKNPAEVKVLRERVNFDGVKAQVIARNLKMIRGEQAAPAKRITGPAKKAATATIHPGQGRVPKSGNQPASGANAPWNEFLNRN
jgi:hypothetical protein